MALAFVDPHRMACHSDHQGPELSKRSRKPFSHGVLKVAVRDTCSSCHAAPKDTVHRGLQVECSKGHESRPWKPAPFDHNRRFVLDRDHEATCETCHENDDRRRYTCCGCHAAGLADPRAGAAGSPGRTRGSTPCGRR